MGEWTLLDKPLKIRKRQWIEEKHDNKEGVKKKSGGGERKLWGGGKI